MAVVVVVVVVADGSRKEVNQSEKIHGTMAQIRCFDIHFFDQFSFHCQKIIMLIQYNIVLIQGEFRDF